MEKSQIRLNKYLAQSGVASRRKADELIELGKVRVNGRTVYELGIQVDPENDQITVQGKNIKRDEEHVYIVFNKPKNVLTAMSDPMNRPTVGGFFGKLPMRIFPVGRLDWDSEGMLLLTNDGEYANKVAHPTKQIGKTYLVKVNGHMQPGHFEKLKNGVSTAVGRVRAVHVAKYRKPEGSDKYDWITITITEGRNRQIRRMFEKIGFDVIKLQRVAIGALEMGPLKRGEYRVITPAMAKKVFASKEKKKI